MKATDFFTKEDILRIRNAVESAEKMTSGEIRVYIEDHSKEVILDRAAFIFSELNMQLTDQRNGVLIYIAFADHKFAVIGDAGIHAIVGQDFWNSVKELMADHFKRKQFTEGIIAGITEAGKVLVKNFPFQRNDNNELPDDIMIK
jgi:uncharacterized membrane protein